MRLRPHSGAPSFRGNEHDPGRNRRSSRRHAKAGGSSRQLHTAGPRPLRSKTMTHEIDTKPDEAWEEWKASSDKRIAAARAIWSPTHGYTRLGRILWAWYRLKHWRIKCCLQHPL